MPPRRWHPRLLLQTCHHHGPTKAGAISQDPDGQLQLGSTQTLQSLHGISRSHIGNNVFRTTDHLNQKLDADLVTNTHSSANSRLSMIIAAQPPIWQPPQHFFPWRQWGLNGDLRRLRLAWRGAPASRTVFSLLRQGTIRAIPCVLSGPCFKSCQDIIKSCRRSQATLQVDSPASFTFRSYVKKANIFA